MTHIEEFKKAKELGRIIYRLCNYKIINMPWGMARDIYLKKRGITGKSEIIIVNEMIDGRLS